MLMNQSPTLATLTQQVIEWLKSRPPLGWSLHPRVFALYRTLMSWTISTLKMATGEICFPLSWHALEMIALTGWNHSVSGFVKLALPVLPLQSTLSDSSCASFVGVNGGSQPVFFGASCTTGNLAHELIHALGLYHEHTRNDRDGYVTIDWSKIIPSKCKILAFWTDSRQTAWNSTTGLDIPYITAQRRSTQSFCDHLK